MKSSLQSPKPLPKSRSRDHLKSSDLSLSAIPRLPKIREQSLETDFLTASDHTLSDLPDPLVISALSAENISPLSNTSDVTSTGITEDHKLLSNSECLTAPDHVSPDLTASSAQRQLLLAPKVHGENSYKGKSDEVISASDLIQKALAEINQSKDITDDTKKIMDAMFEAALQQLNGADSGMRTARLADYDCMIKLRIAILLLVIFFLVVRLVSKLCFADADDWPYGLKPT